MMNNPNYNRYKRGQIWRIFRNPKETRDRIEDKDNHLQEKTRTWLIVSVDISNDNAPILNCVPMTTKLRELPCHVRVQMEGFLCNIMCEHVMTINKSDLTSAEFVGVLDESSMQRVEVALANQLGLSIQVPSMEVLKNFIEKLAIMKAKEMKIRERQVTDEIVLDLATKLENVFDLGKSDEIDTVAEIVDVVTPKPIVTEGSEASEVPSVTGSPKVEIIERPAKRNKWTEENMKQFLDDFDKLSTQEMSTKYGMSMKSLYTTRARFRGLMSESQQG